MQLTLRCRDVSGSVAFPVESIDGLLVPERRYQINDHQVILSGLDFIVHHDVDELLSMPNGLFRMLTVQEQDALSLAAQQAAMVQESVSADVAASQPSQEGSSENAPVDSAPPALPDLNVVDQPKKKASGG